MVIGLAPVSIEPKSEVIEPALSAPTVVIVLTPSLGAYKLAISELLTGIVLIVSYFIKNPIGDTLTRLVGLNIVILMICIFAVAHRDWFITKQLFTSIQIFLLIGGMFFLFKGNKV